MHWAVGAGALLATAQAEKPCITKCNGTLVYGNPRRSRQVGTIKLEGVAELLVGLEHTRFC
jgi:hypothetical protein